jgi:hypothetical protein
VAQAECVRAPVDVPSSKLGRSCFIEKKQLFFPMIFSELGGLKNHGTLKGEDVAELEG